MHLFIDATNLRKGGGVTHITEILKTKAYVTAGFDKVSVLGPSETLEKIGKVSDVTLLRSDVLDRNNFLSRLFRSFVVDKVIPDDVDLLWVPGGVYVGGFRPYVTMLRNLLPFDRVERRRFWLSNNWLRLVLLSLIQRKTITGASGLICLSDYSRAHVSHLVSSHRIPCLTINHGLDVRFLVKPRKQKDISEYTMGRPFRILYVSSIYSYKHQDILVRALSKLISKGYPLHLDLIGAGYPQSVKALCRVINELDIPEYVDWHKEVGYSTINNYYRDADMFVFLSTCETFGNAFLEAMASGLPILASNRSAIPEINGGTCPEVDPEDVDAVAAGLERLIRDKHLRETCAQAAYERAQNFTWKKCADETFAFLSKVAEEENRGQEV